MRRKLWYQILALGLVVGLSFISPIKGVWQNIIAGSAHYIGQKSQGVVEWIGIFNRIEELDKENIALKKQVNELQAQLAADAEIKQENDNLRSQIGLVNSQDAQTIISARVIGRTPKTYIQTLILDQGFKDGVKTGYTVVSDGFLVGQITEVTTTTSQVELITSGRLMVPVVLQNSRASAVLSSTLEGIIIDEIPTDTEVQVGELILTQALENIILPDIPVATVREVIKRKGDIFQQVVADSPIAFNQLEMVMIMGNND